MSRAQQFLNPLFGSTTPPIRGDFAKSAGALWAAGIEVTTSEGLGQTLTFPRGDQIGGNFYANFDSGQGWIALWLTPAWAGDDELDHYFLQWSENGYLCKNSDNNLVLSVADGVTLTVDVSAWTAATRYRVEARWDADNDLDGATNHLALSIDDDHTLGHTADYTPETPAATVYIGTDNAGNNPALALIEGLTIYRRPGWDGANGINLGWGDGIAINTDKCAHTGPWDVVFCLPTNSTAEALAASDTNEAWSQTHASNVLTDGFCLTTYASSAWDTLGTPCTGPSDLAEANKIFPGGYTFTASAGDGIAQTLTGLAAGQNYVLRVIASSDDDIRIVIYDETNSEQSSGTADFDFGAGSSRQTPGHAVFTFELPTTARNGTGANCTSITIRIVSTETDQVINVHQVELLPILVDNPSMATGAGDPWEADGWSESSAPLGGATQELVDIHSGVSCVHYNQTVHHLANDVATLAGVDIYFCSAGWFKLVNGSNAFFSVSPSAAAYPQRSGVAGVNYVYPGTGWDHSTQVWRKRLVNAVACYAGMHATVDDCYVDDAYLYQLTPVTLTLADL